LKNMLVKLDHETPRIRVNIKKYLKPPPSIMFNYNSLLTG